MQQVTASVIENERISGSPGPRAKSRNVLSVHILKLDCPQIAREARPGQYVMVRCETECLLSRPFSIHRVNGDSIDLLFNVWEEGKGTLWLSERQKGDGVDLLGPLGHGFSILPSAKKLLLVAGGIGIAPLYFLSQEALTRKCAVTLLYGTPTDHRYPKKLLPPALKLVEVTDDGSIGEKGLLSQFLPDYIDWADQVFACGPLGIYRDMAAKYHDLLKQKPVQVSLETRMGCGLGTCYACTIKTRKGLKQVCKDGPVFDFEDVLWDRLA